MRKENTVLLSDTDYMSFALDEAKKAAAIGEVPVGCVIVWDDGRIVGRAFNTRETEKNALHHAECKAIDEACRTLNGWRLHRATLYVTLEPCPMCTGAIINARIKRVVFGAYDTKAGAMGSVTDFASMDFNHTPEVVSGVCADEATDLLTTFFASLRQKRRRLI